MTSNKTLQIRSSSTDNEDNSYYYPKICFSLKNHDSNFNIQKAEKKMAYSMSDCTEDEGMSKESFKRLKTKKIRKSKIKKVSNKMALMKNTDNNRHKNCLCYILHEKNFLENKLEGFSSDSIDINPEVYIKKKKGSTKLTEVESIHSLHTPSSIINSHSDSINRVSDQNQKQEGDLINFENTRIKKLCSDLEKLSTKNNDLANNLTPFNCDFLIQNQIKFFKEIGKIIDSFESLNNYMIFKLNNSYCSDDYSTLFKFDKYEQFLKVSSPLKEWLKEYAPNSNKMDSNSTTNNSQKNTLSTGNCDHNKSEIELDIIKKLIDPLIPLKPKNKKKIESDEKSKEIEKDLLIETNSLVTELSEEWISLSLDSNSGVKLDEMRGMIKNSEDQNKKLLFENNHLKKKLNNLLNSKEFKVIYRNEYEALKLQIKSFRHDYKLEMEEKARFQRKSLLYKERLSALSAISNLNNNNDNNNINKLIEMSDF